MFICIHSHAPRQFLLHSRIKGEKSLVPNKSARRSYGIKGKDPKKCIPSKIRVLAMDSAGGHQVTQLAGGLLMNGNTLPSA